MRAAKLGKVLRVPAEDRAAIAAAYPQRGIARVAEFVGYSTRVVARVLREEGVAVRPMPASLARTAES